MKADNMTILNTLRRCDIQHQHRYYDNPDNKNHNVYQAAVNRRFSLAISVFVLAWITVMYGWQPALAFAGGVLIVAGILAVVIMLFPLALEMIHDFLDWLDGY